MLDGHPANLVAQASAPQEERETLGGVPLLRLLQLTSPALPIGAFAYSQGLEAAVEARWVHDETSAGDWILGMIEHALVSLEVPLFGRLYTAWQRGDLPQVRRWSRYLFASRASHELQEEDRRLGEALCRVLTTCGVAGTAESIAPAPLVQLAAFTRACVAWDIPRERAAQGFLFAWAEAQIGAGCRLVPLGQSAAQRLLSRALMLIPDLVRRGLTLPDEDIGFATPGHALGSALHETQYSRIFRS